MPTEFKGGRSSHREDLEGDGAASIREMEDVVDLGFYRPASPIMPWNDADVRGSKYSSPAPKVCVRPWSLAPPCSIATRHYL